MANTKSWVMNETQKSFTEILGQYPNGATLLEIKLEKGKEFKTGSINTLISKGIVIADSEKSFACDIVYNGQIVGKTTKTQKVYRLA